MLDTSSTSWRTLNHCSITRLMTPFYKKNINNWIFFTNSKLLFFPKYSTLSATLFKCNLWVIISTVKSLYDFNVSSSIFMNFLSFFESNADVGSSKSNILAPLSKHLTICILYFSPPENLSN